MFRARWLPKDSRHAAGQYQVDPLQDPFWEQEKSNPSVPQSPIPASLLPDTKAPFGECSSSGQHGGGGRLISAWGPAAPLEEHWSVQVLERALPPSATHQDVPCQARSYRKDLAGKVLQLLVAVPALWIWRPVCGIPTLHSPEL